MADRFRCAHPFGAEEEALLRHWLSGWAVPDLPPVGEFVGAARRAGLSGFRVEDATADAWPSLVCMRAKPLVVYPSAKTLRGFGLCTNAQLARVRTGLAQFEALGGDLWAYAIFAAARDGRDAESS